MHPLLPLLLLSILRAAAAASPAQALRCSGKACGDLNITYPFWLEEPDQPPCGSPSFQLYCNDSHAFMKRSVFGMYNVVRIFPENSSFVVVDHNLPLSTGCPVPHFNISYAVWLSPFNISKSNGEMFFLYNCTKHLQAETLGFHRLPCGNESFNRLGQWEFLEKDPARWDIPPGCNFSVVPFLGSPDAAHYLALMNNGFLLEWTPTWDCAACSASGGQCTYGEASFACLCSDGLHSLTCGMFYKY